MIEIKKEQEPSELITHRKTTYATYENMPVETHQAVLNSLMHEQGFLCAYCMRRIPQKGRIPSATIEHWDPQSQTDTTKALDYKNMLAVCNGNRGSEVRYLTCDAKKQSTAIRVNPLNPATLKTICYQSDGTIYSEDADINTDLNVTLNLNCNRFGLVDSRRDALQRMLKELQAKHSSGDIKRYCAKLLNAYRENSPKTPYVGILIHWLERHC